MGYEEHQQRRRAEEQAAAAARAERKARWRRNAEKAVAALDEAVSVLRRAGVPTRPLTEETWHLAHTTTALGRRLGRPTFSANRREGLRSQGWLFDGFAVDVDWAPWLEWTTEEGKAEFDQRKYRLQEKWQYRLATMVEAWPDRTLTGWMPVDVTELMLDERGYLGTPDFPELITADNPIKPPSTRSPRTLRRGDYWDGHSSEPDVLKIMPRISWEDQGDFLVDALYDAVDQLTRRR